MRKLLAVLAVSAAALVPAFALAAPALANTGVFDLALNDSASDLNGCFVTNEGGGQQYAVSESGGGSNCGTEAPDDFQLSNPMTGHGITAYEFFDSAGNGGCMNVGADHGVYFNSCDGASTEYFFQPSGTHEWENLHYGTNGFLSPDCNFFTCPGTLVANNAPVGWATPQS